MTTNIYGLICPVEGAVKYVGKANNVERRVRDHITDFRTEFRKAAWIRNLLHNDMKPDVVILDVVEMEKWQFWEQWWIEYFKSLGIKLLNYSKGGNGLSVGNHKTFKPGNKPWNLGRKTKI